jgi:U3 small nucleolar ribonucleoprotein component
LKSDAEKFEAVVRTLISVSHEEIQKRDKEWRRKRAKKKQATGYRQKAAKNDVDRR